MRRGRVRASTWAGIAALALSVAACRESAEPTTGRPGFADAMVERFGATDTQAACIADYVFEDYGADEIEVLVDEGMAGLPQARWSPYLNATAACITHDQPLEGGG